MVAVSPTKVRLRLNPEPFLYRLLGSPKNHAGMKRMPDLGQ
jgi:hypothetical protein